MKYLLLAAAAALSIAAPAGAATLVTADRYLDVATGRYVANPAILIGDDGRIQQIGTLAAIQVPAGTKQINLAGQTLLPGLIDMHVHLGSAADIGGYRLPRIYRQLLVSSRGSKRARRCSTPGSRPCATSVPTTGTISASSRPLTRAMSSGRESSRRAIRWAPPAGIATDLSSAEPGEAD